MKLLYFTLALFVSVIANGSRAFASKDATITPIHAVAVAPAKEVAETSNHATIADEKSDLKRKDEKTDNKKAKRYRGDNSTKRVIIIAAIAIAAVAIIIYVVASASTTKN